MMTMLKRIVSVMVSCVFISMVCIPAAHADDVSGSIDLNVQPSPVEPRKMARDGGITDGGAEVLGIFIHRYGRKHNG